ncbi:SCO family protein [Porticoccus sp. GXU_MW_L64]
MKHWASVLATVGVLAAGFAGLSIGTGGWQIWTAESARRVAVQKAPLTLPEANLLNQEGEAMALAADRELWLMEFVYTRCPTVCLAMGAEFYQWQQQLRQQGLEDRVGLLSLTFDPRDSSRDLQGYLQRFSGSADIWRAARFQDASKLTEIMELLGVIAIPEPTVGFVHNAAVYLVYRGQVVGIYDYDDRQSIQVALQRHLYGQAVSAL